MRDARFHISRNPITMLAIGMVASLSMVGCAIYIPIPGGSAGSVCIGFGCGRATRELPAPDPLKITFTHSTKFKQSVAPSIDNFMRRYKGNPADVQISRWTQDFFQPARRILGQEFEFEPAVQVTVNESGSGIVATVVQQEWREVSSTDKSFVRFAALAESTPTNIRSLRWKIKSITSIVPTGDREIRYVSNLEILLEKKLKSSNTYAPVRYGESAALKKLGNRLLKTINDAYRVFFDETYGLTIEL